MDLFGPGFKAIDWQFGSALQKDSEQTILDQPITAVLPQGASPTEDQVRSLVSGTPYYDPLSIDNFGRETSEMQQQYLRFFRTEPAVKAAIRSKINSIKSLDIGVQPGNKRNPHSVALAEFFDWTIKSTPKGWAGMIGDVLTGACLQGFSANEIVLKEHTEHESTQWKGFVGLKYLKPKNAANLMFQLDGYRNVIGLVNNVIGTATYPRRKFVLFSHDMLFDDPSGASDLRSATRACQLIDRAIRLWYYAEEVFGGPVVVGRYADQNRRQALEKALIAFRQGGWLSVPKEDEIQILNLASSIGADGKSKLIDKMREEIFMSVRNAFTPFMPGGGGQEFGNTQITKSVSSDPEEETLAKAFCQIINTDLAPAISGRNFPPGTELPKITLGGTNWADTKQQLEVVEIVEKRLGRPVDDDYVYEISRMPPGQAKVDPAQAGGAMPGQAPAGGQAPGQAPGQPAAPQAGAPQGEAQPSADPAQAGQPAAKPANPGEAMAAPSGKEQPLFGALPPEVAAMGV